MYNKNQPVRVLQIAGTLAPGGIESFLVNLHEHMDLSRVTFDYAVHAQAEGAYAERVKAMGARVYLLPRLSHDPAGNLREIGRLVRENRYDVVVRNTPNAMITPQLIAAKKNGAGTVLHAHASLDPMKAAHFAGRLLVDRAADVRVACSEAAGRWMFGKRTFTLMKNAVDLGKFAYRAEAEARIRDEFHLEGAHLYGAIGNLRPEKNHRYTLEVFRKIKDADDAAVLLCVGDGALRPEIEARIRELHLDDSVILAGMRNDVADIMCALDVLFFPSLFEGMPVTLIEAQASGLPVLLSDRITRDAEVTKGLMTYLSIDGAPELWAEHAAGKMAEINAAQKPSMRIQQTQTIAEHGYDIERMAGEYRDMIVRLATERR